MKAMAEWDSPFACATDMCYRMCGITLVALQKLGDF
jgi:hypothetical protein